MKNLKIGFIGIGNMANAIIGGVLKSGVPAEQISLYDLFPEKCENLRAKGMTVYRSAQELTAECGIIFLTVKPQNFAEVLEQIRPAASETKIFVSIAAGVSTGYIKKQLGGSYTVFRAMPNTPLLLGKGATALYCPPDVPEESSRLVKSFFEACGVVRLVQEEEINAVTSISGSSPAYFYLFAKAMMEYAQQEGLDPETAKALICQTMIGSAAMLLESGQTPDELIRMVSSPGGTTLEAMNVLRSRDVERILCDAMKACTRRAGELEK